MSRFAPTSVSLDPPDRPDYLAGAVLASLGRGLARKRAWGPIKTAIFGGLSFGILPLLIWPRRFQDVCLKEQQQYWHLAEWLRVRTGLPEATSLRDSTRRLSATGFAVGLPVLLAIGIGIYMLRLLTQHSLDFGGMLNEAYHLRGGPFETHNWSPLPYGYAASVFWAWTWAMGIGFAIHWLQIVTHAGDVRWFTQQFNSVIVREGMQPVPTRDTGMGFGVLWLLLVIFGLTHGAIWMIPMALAGAAQRQYVRTTTTQLRADLADRVRLILLRHRPAVDVPLPVRLTSPDDLRLACVNDRCRAPLKLGARFCSRCGARTPAAMAVA
jgi:hypothetical protein